MEGLSTQDTRYIRGPGSRDYISEQSRPNKSDLFMHLVKQSRKSLRIRDPQGKPATIMTKNTGRITALKILVNRLCSWARVGLM